MSVCFEAMSLTTEWLSEVEMIESGERNDFDPTVWVWEIVLFSYQILPIISTAVDNSTLCGKDYAFISPSYEAYLLSGLWSIYGLLRHL